MQGPVLFVIAVPDALASGTGGALVLDSVLRLVNNSRPLEQDGDQSLGADIPTVLGW